MIQRVIFLLVLTIALASCQFTETMVLHEDGTGQMAIEMDLSEMMGFAGEMSKDSTMVKTDTIISFKTVFEEKKDSIANLSKEEQKRLKKMEKYNLRLKVNPDSSAMSLAVFINFKNVNEANDLMKGFNQVNDKIPGAKKKNNEENKKDENDLIGVRYLYKKNSFKRDAYIKDIAKHTSQIDSMKSAEAFMSAMKYTIKYTFPKPIKKASVKDAVYSEDRKTISITRGFIDYFKNPDILDIEIELEK